MKVQATEVHYNGWVNQEVFVRGSGSQPVFELIESLCNYVQHS